ncbi:RcnB family protein [Lysobacter sp. HA35]
MTCISPLVLIASLMLAGPALADPGHGKGHDKGHGSDKHERYEGIRIGEPNPHGPMPMHHDNGRHLGQYKQWARGERMPVTYLAPRYYVRNYTVYHLAPPPRGMVWVRPYEDSQQVYLVQAATGLIQRILGI